MPAPVGLQYLLPGTTVAAAWRPLTCAARRTPSVTGGLEAAPVCLYYVAYNLVVQNQKRKKNYFEALCWSAIILIGTVHSTVQHSSIVLDSCIAGTMLAVPCSSSPHLDSVALLPRRQLHSPKQGCILLLQDTRVHTYIHGHPRRKHGGQRIRDCWFETVKIRNGNNFAAFCGGCSNCLTLCTVMHSHAA